ncbi:multidrug efflux SMR transporter [Paucibacter sp. B2R-40]|uniref:DMT family transporter n=1 Tax=Paucibacter sp. B2R-40 TaxID=2893554 RepID=UPI0021E50586|nr:multidrug efflux SMR transporter [Paucibacter sp. B2R-40]MCV2353824.1 multidrug efflux SMR transporter [Paucibacter sp. B2R-40]
MQTMPIIFIMGSACSDIAANMMLEKSNGFKNRAWGFGAIAMLWLAFLMLGQAIKSIDLAIAYAMWGSIGILGTSICGRLLFGHRLKPIAWLGIALVIAAVLILSLVE